MRSISTIALVTTMPTSISTPISAGTPSGVPVASSRPIAPVAANGIETSSSNGCSRLRNVATMIRKTIAIAASTARPRSAKASAWSALTPPILYDAPAGRVERVEPLGQVGGGRAEVGAGGRAVDGGAAVAVDPGDLLRAVDLA